MKQDITRYSNSELSLLVFNDEGLYHMRHQRDFTEFIDEMYIFTDEQMAELITDLEIDARELEEECI